MSRTRSDVGGRVSVSVVPRKPKLDASPVRDERFTLRIPSKLLEAIKAEALRDKRSVADVIVMTLERRFGGG